MNIINNSDKEIYIKRLKAFGLRWCQNNEKVYMDWFDRLMEELKKDGICSDSKDFKRIFRWYALGKPPQKSIDDCERAIKKTVPDIDEEVLYRDVGYILTLASSRGGGDNYDEYLSYAEGYYARQKMYRIIREMIPDKSDEEYNNLCHRFSSEFYKDAKDYRYKKMFDELEFRNIINNYIINSK